MRNQKIKLVEAYLTRNFADSSVEYKHDFDLEAEAFKVSIDGNTALLKVSGVFLDDNSEAKILEQFDLWALPTLLKKEKKLGVLVTTDGLFPIVH